MTAQQLGEALLSLPPELKQAKVWIQILEGRIPATYLWVWDQGRLDDDAPTVVLFPNGFWSDAYPRADVIFDLK